MMASARPALAQGAGGGGNLPRAGNADDFDIGAVGAAAQQRIESAIEQAVGDDGVPARDNDGEFHAGGGEIAFEGDGLAFHGIGPGPEAEAEAGFGLDREDARLPVRFRDGREMR